MKTDVARIADGREFITPLQAIALLPEGETVHTFRNPAPGFMVGADWERSEIIKALSKAGPKEIELGGPECRRAKHGLILWTDGSPLFIQANLPGGE